MNSQLINYEDLSAPLLKLDPDKEPSEIHGSLCGILCANNSIDQNSWAPLVMPQIDANNLNHVESMEFLIQLYKQSIEQLNDPSCEFQLILPSEHNVDTLAQVDSLGEWCQGFLIGLNLGGLSDFESLPEDSAELVRDFTEIARAGTSYELDDNDDNQHSLFELIEYVRIGVLLINEELHPIKAAPLDSSSVH